MKRTLIPERYRGEYRRKQKVLLRSRVNIFCIVTVLIFFLVTANYLARHPENFRPEEIPNWLFLASASAGILFLNATARTLRQRKLIGFLYTALFLFALSNVGIIYAESATVFPFYFALLLFFASVVIPWTASEVVLLVVMDAAAYLLYYLNVTRILGQDVFVFSRFHPLFDGLVFIGIGAYMCYLIRRNETARDIENFVLLKEVQEKNEQIRKELELATRVHRTLIPESITNDRVDISVSYLPMHDIGGDYARFHFLEGRDSLVFIIGDVTGHGVPAALMVNRLHTEFESLAKQGIEPGILLKELNAFIVEGFAGTSLFFSAFSGMLEFASGKFSYSNYGHPAQYIYHVSKGRLVPLASQTVLLGVDAGTGEIHQNELSFGPGDRILLFTDGVLETRNETGVEYGTGNLEAFILGHGTLTAQEFNRGLVDELHAFKGGGNFRDDVFLLSIKIR